MYKVMIVDDEAVIRKGLFSLINWSDLDCEVVYESINGLDAKNYLADNSVDILVSDIKMPEMDGIALSKYIYEFHPSIKVIMLTAYADFSYAQSAIKYNVVDFVIKTSYANKIPEAIRKAINLIAAEKDNIVKLKFLEETLGENLIEMREKYIKDILSGIIINYENIDTKLKEYDFDLSNYYILSYEINPNAHHASKSNENISNQDYSRFVLSIKNFLSLALKDYLNLTIIMNKNHLISIVSFSINDINSSTNLLIVSCNEILSMVEGFMKFTIKIGISRIHHAAGEIMDAYIESKDALSKTFYNENNVSFFSSSTADINNYPDVQVQKYIDDILNYIKTDSAKSAISLLFDLFEKYRINKETVEKIKVSGILICSACYNLLTEYGLSGCENIQPERYLYKNIENCKTIKDLNYIINSLIESCASIITNNSSKKNFLIQEVNKYIFQNYNKEINLQSIAEHIHVNSSYLSSLYKRETGEALIEYLNRYRIDIAKKLLKDPSKKIYEVGVAVGIEDPAYFTQVFTKYTGSSPKEFRIQL